MTISTSRKVAFFILQQEKFFDKLHVHPNHFRKAYNELFLSNSILLKDLTQEKVQMVIRYLMLTFFDGILTAKIISES